MMIDGKLSRNPLKGGLSDARSRPQHDDAAEEAAASLCPVWASFPGSDESQIAISVGLTAGQFEKFNCPG